MNERDRKIESALASYPLVRLPANFSSRLLARLPANIAPKPARFRLEFVDLAIPGFLVLFNVLLFIVLAWTLNAFDPFWLMRGRLQLQLLFQLQLQLLWRQFLLQPEGILWVLLASWALCLVLALLLGTLLLKQPRLGFREV